MSGKWDGCGVTTEVLILCSLAHVPGSAIDPARAVSIGVHRKQLLQPCHTGLSRRLISDKFHV